jgi:hypothetical protein
VHIILFLLVLLNEFVTPYIPRITYQSFSDFQRPPNPFEKMAESLDKVIRCGLYMATHRELVAYKMWMEADYLRRSPWAAQVQRYEALFLLLDDCNLR